MKKKNNKRTSRKVLTKAQRRKDRRERQKRWLRESGNEKHSPRNHYNVLDLQGFRETKRYKDKVKEFAESLRAEGLPEYEDWGTWVASGIVTMNHKNTQSVKIVYRVPVKAPFEPDTPNPHMQTIWNTAMHVAVPALIQRYNIPRSEWDSQAQDSFFVGLSDERMKLMLDIPPNTYRYLMKGTNYDESNPKGSNIQYRVNMDSSKGPERHSNLVKRGSQSKWKPLFYRQFEDVAEEVKRKHIGARVPCVADMENMKMFIVEHSRTGKKVLEMNTDFESVFQSIISREAV